MRLDALNYLCKFNRQQRHKYYSKIHPHILYSLNLVGGDVTIAVISGRGCDLNTRVHLRLQICYC